jgi:hypothetical protein
MAAAGPESTLTFAGTQGRNLENYGGVVSERKKSSGTV